MAEEKWGPFTDARQAEQHLAGRYIIFTPEGEQPRAVYVTNVVGDMGGDIGKVQLGDPEGMAMNRPEDQHSINHPGFNQFRFDPLGWINHDMGAVQAELVPIRQTRRGYGRENVNLWWFTGGTSLSNPEELSIDKVLRSDGFNEMLRNEYPTLNDAVRAAVGQPNISIAVSRKLVVQSDEDGYAWLWRVADRIGMFSNAETCNLGRRFTFLREELLDTLLFNDGVWLK